jgi:hypothetical protein
MIEENKVNNLNKRQSINEDNGINEEFYEMIKE